MDRDNMAHPYYWEVELKLDGPRPATAPGRTLIDVRLSIANIDYTIQKTYAWGIVNIPGTAYRQEWAQCPWAQGGNNDPLLPQTGRWEITSDGALQLYGPGIGQV